MPTTEWHVSRDPSTTVQAAATAVLSLLQAAVGARGRATLVLAGGTTPRLLYQTLVARGRAAAPWEQVDLFFGDERCVPTTSPASNYALALRHLITPLGLGQQQVHRIDGERRPPSTAAVEYETHLRRFFGPGGPRWDVVLLGVGTDGHTASLFPGQDSLQDTRRWVVATRAPEGIVPPDRVTLTMAAINRARAVCFLATGLAKRPVITAMQAGATAADRFPARMVRATGRTRWFVDAAAAGLNEGEPAERAQ